MAVRLDELPTEILESILFHLPTEDICNVRLTSRALQQKATLRSFRNAFQHKHLYVTQESLDDFILVTQAGRLGCLVEELTLYGLAVDYNQLSHTLEKGTITHRHFSGLISMSYERPFLFADKQKARSDLDTLSRLKSTNQRLYQSGEAVGLLAQAFRHLAANSPMRQLRRLSLDVSCLADDPGKRLEPVQFANRLRIREIWASAEQIFHIASMLFWYPDSLIISIVSALAESGLHVEELVLFNSPSYLCSLFRDQLRLLDLSRLNTLTSCLSALSLSLSAREHILQAPDDSDTRFGVEVPDDFSGLGMLLAQCPKLKILDIHCYSTEYSMTWPIDGITVPRFAASGAAHNNPDWELAELEELIIAGLPIREHDLLEFLKRAKPARLELECIKVTDGMFRSVFDFCTTSNPKLKSINLKSLYELEILWFPDPARDRFYLDVVYDPAVPHPGAISLTREGDDVRLPIDYHSPNIPLVSSHRNNLYYHQMGRRFGPSRLG